MRTSMVRLDAKDYGRVGSLAAPLEFHLALVALLSGTAPGVVYAADPAAPGVFLAHTGSRFYLAGRETLSEAVAGLFATTLVPQALAAGRTGLLLCYDPPGWERSIASFLPAWETVQTRREYYELTSPPAGPPRSLPDGFTLRPAGRALLDDERIAGLDALREEMCSERPSVDDFLAASFGVCALYGDHLAGWCLSEYNTGPRCEIGIAALEPYRRRGLATAMTAAFVVTARERGITRIGWDCFARNVASGAAARAAGFQLVHSYPAYLAWIDDKTAV